MNSALILQDVVYVVALLAIGYPLGCYIYKIYNGERVALMRIFAPLEQLLYRVMGVDEEQQMHAKKYASSVLWFSLFGFLIVMGLHLVQAWLPLNPEQLDNTSVHLAYNTAASFVSNTNWQAYSGETTLSYLTQMAGLTVQNFVSAATGIAVLFVLCRGFVRRETKNLGNFWSDLVKITLYILLPLSVVVCLILVSQGVYRHWIRMHPIRHWKEHRVCCRWDLRPVRLPSSSWAPTAAASSVSIRHSRMKMQHRCPILLKRSAYC